jgi:MOSC domain-containing protein
LVKVVWYAEGEERRCDERIGGLRMRVDKHDLRCVVPTIDPVTLRRNPAILRTIARGRGNRFGVYGSTVQPGGVAVGDPVGLEP